MNNNQTLIFQPVFEGNMGWDDFEQSRQAHVKLFNEHVKLLDFLEGNEDEPISIILNPLVFGIFTSNEYMEAVDQFLEEKIGAYQEEKEKAVLLYSKWLKWNKNMAQAYKGIVQEGKALIIPTTVNSLPLTHYRTSTSMQIQVRASVELYKRYLGVDPEFFWLPKAAYVPGIDLYLLKEGIKATFISSFSFDFSEKEEVGARILRSPRGLSLIPVHEGDKNEAFGVPHATLHLGTMVEETDEETLTSIQHWINASASLARVGFGYIGMEKQEPIIEDAQMKEIRKVHELEEILERVKSETVVNSQEYHQIMREFISLLHRVDSGITEIDRFKQVITLIMDGRTEDPLYQHQLKQNKIPSDDILEAISDYRPSSPHKDSRDAVLILSWEYPPNIVGGLSRHVYDLANNLVRKGKKVHVLTARSKDSLAIEVIEGVTIHRVHPLHPYEENFFKWVFDLNQSFIQYAHDLIKEERITHIHAHDWIVSTSAIKLKEYYSLPLITTIHATEHGRNQGIHTELQEKIHREEQLLVSLSDYLIVCSDHMKEEVQSLFTFEAPIEVIPNGVELERMVDVQSIQKIGVDRPYFFSVGRMVHEKGFETLIRTAALMKNDGHHISFIIAGKGPMLDHYRQQVKQGNLEDTVIFTGFISDEERNSYLKNCIAVIFPSLYEPFGIVALEAMAFRKGVVASETGGLKSIVKHEQSGLLFQPDNENDLYALLQSLMNERGKSERLGEVGFKLAQSMFSWERIAERTMHVYEDVLLQTKVEGLRR
ncbi:glycosyltransferase [Rossellomorea aquimaris]|uniref:glycosyltransferase family 4 protein n=1 Tax=Rossellomorea aquimaris TaxID=189382 RepID=UPI001CD47BD0|nr:glycosyltransferase family 4 protein [Rossellomorea aquimaris]MCA1054833.1 glycosyltransferase [Rossellomorea aquimaris]